MAGTRITTPSGRPLGLSQPVCHPSAGSADFDPDPVVTDRWGVHLVALDRPGCGSSHPLPEGSARRVVERAADVADFLQQQSREEEPVRLADVDPVHPDRG